MHEMEIKYQIFLMVMRAKYQKKKRYSEKHWNDFHLVKEQKFNPWMEDTR